MSDDLRPADFIDLDRRFVAHAQGGGDSDTLWAEVFAERQERRDWDWLFEHRIAALLAEAGAGKSYEFRAQADRLNADGRPAFYLRIERMLGESIEGAFETADQKSRFERWRGTGREAIFFLDSVDEAKLPKGKGAEPLRDALAALERAVGSGGLAHVRLVVSCRASEWHGDTEESHLLAFAGRLKAARVQAKLAADDGEAVKSLTFASLDRERVRIIAVAIDSAEGAGKLIDAIDAEQLWDEVRTPMDAVHYAGLFAAAGEEERRALLRSRTAIFEASVNRRLADGGDSRSRNALALDTAWKAAAFLAFAVIVMEKRDLGFDRTDPDALDATAILGQAPLALSANEVRQLLSTALFTPAGRGRVRFYRPEIEAMLAAHCLEPQLQLVPAAKLFAAFCPAAFGIASVPQKYGPMLAWLATRDRHILRLLLDLAPHFIIEDGDPRALAVGDLVAALERHVRITHRNLDPGFYFESSAIARFAEPELEPTVVALAQETAVTEMRVHLLQMIRMGRYASAADWVEHVCGDGFTPSDVRLYAIRALVACGTDAHLRRLADTLLAWGAPLPDRRRGDFTVRRADDVRIQLIGAAYPHAIDLDRMLRLVAQIRGREHSLDSEILVVLAERAPMDDILPLLDGLERLTWASMPRIIFGHDSPILTRRAGLLFDALSTSIARAIAHFPDAVRLESIDACFTASRYSRLDRDKEEWTEIVDALSRAPGVRVRMMTAALDMDAAHHALFGVADRLEKVWRNHPDAPEADLAFALGAYAAAPSSHRERWSDFLLRWVSPISSARHRRLSASLIALAVRHRAGPDLATVNAARWHPFARPVRAWKRFEMRPPGYTRRRLTQFVTDRMDVAARPVRLLRNWKRVGEGQELGLLLEQLFKDDHDVVDRATLAERHGERLANQLVAGAIAWVRSMQPGIRYRYDIRQLIESGLRWGQAADPEFVGTLPEPARQAAIEHILRDHQSPDPWVAALARVDPAHWTGSSVEILRSELAARARFDPEWSNTSLAQWTALPADIQKLAASALLAWAEANPAMARRDIGPLADIVALDPALLAPLVSLARRSAREAFHEAQLPRALRWLAVWAQHDAAAMDDYVAWLRAVRGDADAEHHMILTLGALLGGRRGGEVPIIADLPAAARLDLALLLHQIVRFDDDEPANEGIQTVTPRRDREDVRRAVQNYLGDDRSAAGREALLTFIAAAIEPYNALWAQDWRTAHAHAAARRQPWSGEELWHFAARGLISPRDGAALAERVRDEIDAIAAALDMSEFDRRALLNPNIYESDFRAWLGHELDQRIQPWAAITQETVTRSEKRSDLRIELRGGDRAVVVVEIKLTHRWSRAELLEKIETQLADQYLIGDARIRHGIYLLADVGAPLTGKLADGSAPDMRDFMALARQRAKALCIAGGRQLDAQLLTVIHARPAR